MPQSKWERGFWAAVRGGGTGGFNPYPPEHWRKPKKNSYKKTNKLKKLYCMAYPTDKLGEKIRENATVESVLKTPWRVYDITGVGDSLMRERIFDIVSRRKKITYNSIYDAWLSKSWKKGPVKKADIVIGKKNKKVKKGLKKDFLKKHIKVVTIPDTFFN